MTRVSGRSRRPRRARRAVVRRTRALTAEVVRYLRTETIGGIIMLTATVLALVAVNSPLRTGYERLRDFRFGPAALHLDLPLSAWAADGLLTLFFVVAGLELKREVVLGELRGLRRALLPVVSAVGGMVAPALVCLAVAAGTAGAADAWPVPVATDIAFALAVLAVTASALPASVRAFLLSLAVVDDLGAILLIAGLYTDRVAWLPLLLAAAAVAGYWLVQRLWPPGPGVLRWVAPAVLGMAAWAALHASGIHATVAGVALALVTRTRRAPAEAHSPAEVLEHRLQPVSAGFAVPVFAFLTAGVPLSASALRDLTTDRIAWAVIAGMLVGKGIGVLGGAWLAVTLRLGRLPRGLRWPDLAAVSILTGCGFTVSLLIAELAFAGPAQDRVKAAVLVGSTAAALVAAALLHRRSRLRRG